MESTRKAWVEALDRIAFPVIEALGENKLRERLPLTKAEKKRGVGYLEAFGRTLGGIAPWVAADAQEEWERSLQEKYRVLIRKGIENCTNPDGPDYFVWKADAAHWPNQPIVDAAYFVSGILKARKFLWEPLDAAVKKQVIRALRDVAGIRTNSWSNWQMFGAMVEVGLYELTGRCDTMKLEFALTKLDEFYAGDGTYGDGKEFAWDYYNSYVMQPFLEECTEKAAHLFQSGGFGETLRGEVVRRLQRYCEVQERLIAPDGSYVATGRSSVYRMAAFQSIAHAAYRHLLPAAVSPGQARRALTRVTGKIMEAPTLFDANGFLRPGIYGHQPSMRDSYVNTGSLSICTAVFLPLGLSPDDPFWSAPEEPLTWEKAWSGQDLPRMESMQERQVAK